MRSWLKDIVLHKEKEDIKEFLSDLDKKENWTLITIIDELCPYLVMESNLRYGNFHMIKMSLFLRKLTLKNYFSKTTQRELARLIIGELVERDWINIEAEKIFFGQEFNYRPIQKMKEELNNRNIQNAFYYALSALKEDKGLLIQTLLNLGAISIQESLGHTLSCFFPVMEDIVNTNHPCTETALFSYLMYLIRFRIGEFSISKENRVKKDRIDYGELLRKCASGDGIINLHHMITFYVYTIWEDADFTKDEVVPYNILEDWIQGKKLDENRIKRLNHIPTFSSLPTNYKQFSNQFSLDNTEATISILLHLIENNDRNCIDWIFRVYTEYYEPGNWDPHYYTGIYSAINLYFGKKIRDKTALRMAVEQAVHYFAYGLKRRG